MPSVIHLTWLEKIEAFSVETYCHHTDIGLRRPFQSFLINKTLLPKTNMKNNNGVIVYIQIFLKGENILLFLSFT